MLHVTVPVFHSRMHLLDIFLGNFSHISDPEEKEK